MSARVVWPVLLAVGVAAEVRSLVRGDGSTLSETWRAWARTDTSAGRYGTGLFFGLLFGWLVPHLNRAPK